jgi:hypothetical protein
METKNIEFNKSLWDTFKGMAKFREEDPFVSRIIA